MFFRNSSEKLSIATLKRGGYTDEHINSLSPEDRIMQAQKILENERTTPQAQAQEQVAAMADLLATQQVRASDTAPPIPQTLEETGLRLLALESRLEMLLNHLRIKNI